MIITMLKRQMREEYYRGNKSFETICKRYDWIDPEDIKDVLGIYDINKGVPEKSSFVSKTFMKDWNDICRKLNPKAWEDKNIIID